MRATRAIIHCNNLRHNINSIKNHLPAGKKICIAVKADAYGHGATMVSRIASDEGVDMLCVATIGEAKELRDTGITIPILLLSIPLPEEIDLLFTHHIIPIVASEDFIRLLEAEGKRRGECCEAHLKIDTGMGRLGCKPEEAFGLAEMIAGSPFVDLGGICTHFPGSDLKDASFAKEQVMLFGNIIKEIKNAGIDPGLIHTANSGAVINLPESYFDMVRLGILVYGYYPSKEQERILPIKPVLEFCSKIIFIKRVDKDTPVSYGMTYKTRRETCIATIAVGYGDGYSRLLSNRGEVLIRGKRYPLVGRVCMDHVMVDVGPSPEVKLYDDVVLFGPDPEGPDAEEIAGIMGTIPYEVTCLVGKRVPRVFYGEE
jgi:alanine racemase